MKLHTAPAAYTRYIDDVLVDAKGRIAHDIDCRADEHVGVQALAPVPNAAIEGERTGTLVIVTLDADNPDDVAALTEIIQRTAPRSA